jgi:hypothetical protein
MEQEKSEDEGKCESTNPRKSYESQAILLEMSKSLRWPTFKSPYSVYLDLAISFAGVARLFLRLYAFCSALLLEGEDNRTSLASY